MATTPGGLTYPIATDAFDPSGDMADLAASADAGRIIAVPNAAARAALAVALATRPLYVHRQDAPVGARLEFTEDGTTWQVVWAGDTDWTSLSLVSGQGLSGSAAWRCVGGVGEIRFDISGAISTDAALTAAIPASYRPAGVFAPAATYFDPVAARAAAAAYVDNASGVLRATGGGAVTVTRLRGRAHWIIA